VEAISTFSFGRRIQYMICLAKDKITLQEKENIETPEDSIIILSFALSRQGLVAT